MWLVSGRSRSTTPRFVRLRTKSKRELRTLYRHVCRIAAAMGLIRLIDVGVWKGRVCAPRTDGRRTSNQKQDRGVAEKELERQWERGGIRPSRTGGLHGCVAVGCGATVGSAASRIFQADLRERQARLRELLANRPRKTDQGRRREGIDPERGPARAPRTDPDSRVLPNKEGGYAPNYTP